MEDDEIFMVEEGSIDKQGTFIRKHRECILLDELIKLSPWYMSSSVCTEAAQTTETKNIKKLQEMHMRRRWSRTFHSMKPQYNFFTKSILYQALFSTSHLPRTTLYRYYHDIKIINDIILKESAKLDRVDYTLQTQIANLLSVTPYISNRKISSQLGTSLSTINHYLHEHLQMTFKSCIIIPHELTPPELRQQRIKYAKVISAILRELKESQYLPLEV